MLARKSGEGKATKARWRPIEVWCGGVGGMRCRCFASTTFGGKIPSQSALVYIHAAGHRHTHTHGDWVWFVGGTPPLQRITICLPTVESPLALATINHLPLSLCPPSLPLSHVLDLLVSCREEIERGGMCGLGKGQSVTTRVACDGLTGAKRSQAIAPKLWRCHWGTDSTATATAVQRGAV